jgi:hypothetical protein
MFGAQNFPALIRELLGDLAPRRAQPGASDASSAARWRTRAYDLALRRIKAPHELLDWAKRDRHWSFTLAEVLRESTSHPSELAARLVVAMLEQLDEEREMAEADAPTDGLAVHGQAFAD